MEQKILDIINEAEMVLVGIGEEFSPAYPCRKKDMQGAGLPGEDGAQAEDALLPYRKSKFYEELPSDHPVICAYNKLRRILGAKPYFVVTMNTDDLIFRSQIEEDLTVAPCGSMGKMQCGEHIVAAADICEKVLACKDTKPAVCPHCGKPLQFHTVHVPGYMEEGYLEQWQKYTKWLQCTPNRRLRILELGVGFQYPQVIRWPFEKVTAYNLKATLIRVHSKLPQLPEELAQRGISVKSSPVQFLLEE